MTTRVRIAALAAAGGASVAAFGLAPAALLGGRYGQYADHATLRTALARGLVEFWRGGSATLPAGLQELVDYWFAWHAIKIGISLVMVAAFGLLAAALWRRYLERGAAGHVAATLSTVLAVLAAVALTANIQATAAPLMALMPFLSDDEPDAALAPVFRELVAGPPDSPPGTVLLDTVQRYHATLAVVAAVLAVALAAASVVAWRRRAGAAAVPRLRTACTSIGVITAVAAAGFAVLAIFGVVSASDPAVALVDVLGADR